MKFEDLASRVDAQFKQTRSELEALVRIPSISADAFDQSQVRRSAELVAEYARDRGFTVDVKQVKVDNGTVGRPAVLAHRQGKPGKPSVLLYAHHDVQPEGDRSGWLSDPFEPEERNGRLYGRGTGDDRAGVITHMAALRALGDDLDLGVTLFIEGEEEVGSPTFRDFLNAYSDELASDVIVVADSTNWKVGTPSLTTSLRGVCSVSVTVDVLDHAVHSGSFGGPVLDAVTLMSRLIATLHNADGSVAVAGLTAYDDAAVDYPEADLRKDAGILPGVELAGTGSITSRLWTKPAIAVIGMDVTSCAASSNTIIPSCTARLSLRVAPGQDPMEAAQALIDHCVKHAPFGACATARVLEAGPSFKAAGESDTSRIARWALEKAWNAPSVDIGGGGSIPFISDLAEKFPDAEILVTGMEDPDTRAHSQNESLDLREFRNGILAEAALLARLDGKL
ncbi:MAG: dipeptidase [Ancrocorticia sp.]|jgi:acetylornithine deacetylase/succinyl-diaminopimelate desuccinylase-like protein|nr:dipeptidase [Ancrocorticia sp.]MCI2194128.1 dipeptidase [Ancrocorticia sp.]MCI2199078.1 dipeptidase [Ancrocorticia sp.]